MSYNCLLWHDRFFYSKCSKWFVSSLILNLVQLLVASEIHPDESGKPKQTAMLWAVKPENERLFMIIDGFISMIHPFHITHSHLVHC